MFYLGRHLTLLLYATTLVAREASFASILPLQ